MVSFQSGAYIQEVLGLDVLEGAYDTHQTGLEWSSGCLPGTASNQFPGNRVGSVAPGPPLFHSTPDQDSFRQ